MKITESMIITNLFYSVLSATIITSTLVILSKIKKARILIAFFLVFFLSLDSVYIYLYSHTLSLGVLASIFETDFTETKGFLLENAIAVILIFCSLFFLIYKTLKETAKNNIRIKYPIILISTSFILSISMITYLLYHDQLGKHLFKQRIKHMPIMAIHESISNKFPLGINSSVLLIAYSNEMYMFRKEINRPKSLTEGIYLPENSNSPQNIFVVIGESSVSTHYSLYGYILSTTPFLDSLAKQEKLKYFKAISVASLTREAIRMTLSFASPLDDRPFYENKNIITMANNAGYQTYWISNQSKVGIDDSYIGLLASYAQQQEFYEYQIDDLDLLDIVEQNVKQSENSKKIFFIHTKGSHIAYKDKYDSEDVKYMKDQCNINTNRGFDYDCSIHHTDKFLEKLYKLIQNEDNKNKSSLIIYYSDHGEIINKGHGFMLGDERDREQFKIPLILIPSNDSIKTEQYISPYIHDGIVNSNSISYILASILGYSIDEKLKEKASQEAKYFYQIDGKTYPISTIK